MSATVAVIGGGYGGIAVAKALDEAADVVLVEPRDTFVHNVATLRGLVDPQWTDWLFLPYDRLLGRGEVVKDRAVHVDAGAVTLGAGERIDADYVVLATGSAYPFPAKIEGDSAGRKARLRAAYGALAQAGSVLLLGAGPVGLELAGEIAAAWPDKHVTIVDPGADIVGGRFPEEFRTELRSQLDALGVELLLGTSLAADPPTEAGTAAPFTATTTTGREIAADIWFRCYGIVPTSDYLSDGLAAARQPSGHLEVTPELRLRGQERVFAIGDVTAVAEPKMAKAAGLHADVVATNIRSLIKGDGELVTYTPAPPGISLPLGPTGGASYAPEVGVLGAAQTAELKGSHLRLSAYEELLGL